MQSRGVSLRSLYAVAGVLSLLTIAGCATDDPPGEDDPSADPTGDVELRETASPATTASPSLIGAAAPEGPASTLPSLRPGATTHDCRRTCTDVVHPELCFIVPFPFCLIPQHDCVTLCDVP